MATAPRALWKGAIAFGLVHVPVALHSAIEDTRPKFKMVAGESGSAVGYKKVDKATGQEVSNEEISKGVDVGAGQYVTLTKEEIAQALPRTMQTIEIEAFVKLADIPPVFFNKPYYTSPQGRGQKVYALLRDVLRRTGRVGIGRVVVSSKQHLAVVIPQGNALLVNLLRWSEEVRDPAALPLPGTASELGITERDLELGEQLVLDLAADWDPSQYHDEFKAKLEQLVEAKRERGEVLQVEPAHEALPSAEVIDLTELLRRSLKASAAGAVSPTEPVLAAAKPARTSARKPLPKDAANDPAAARDRAAAASRADGKSTTAVPVRRTAAKRPKAN